jgi:glycosyltransferase involved in cell wall biosynthesis
LADNAVTAAIPVRDGERYLAEAIESVLAQTHRPSQVIVVDNGSSDGSAEVARRYEPDVTVRFESRVGIGPARNAALAAAEGNYIAFLDADDLWQPEKTEVQLAAFERDPSLGLVFGHVLQFLSPDLDPSVAAGLRLPGAPQPGLYVGAMLASRAAWEEIGPWPGDLEISDGLTWLLRARELGIREWMAPQTVTRRRVHGANHSLRYSDRRTEFAHVLKCSLDARRAAGRA